jgi:uncharacterized protein
MKAKGPKGKENRELPGGCKEQARPGSLPPPHGCKPSRYNFIFQDTDGQGSLLLYNALTQSISRVPDHPLKDRVRSVLEGTEAPARLPLHLQEALAQEGFLVPPEVNEFDLYREQLQSHRFDTSAYYLTVALTLDCNFRCLYCFVPPRTGQMDRQTVASLKKFVVNDVIPGISNLELYWYGGEPLLTKDLLLELQTFFQERCRERGVGYRSVLFTNGYYLDPWVAEKLAASGTQLAWVTLDGPPAIHNRRRVLLGGEPTFARIYANVKAVLGIFPHLNLLVNLDRENWGAFLPLMEILERDGLLSRVTIIPGIVKIPSGWNQSYASRCFPLWDHFRLLIEANKVLVIKGVQDGSLFELKGFTRCVALRRAWAIIDPAGLVYQCFHGLGQPERAVGQLHDGMLVYNESVKRWLRFDPSSPRKCQNCRYLPICLANRCFYGEVNRLRGTWKCDGIQDHLEAFVRLNHQRLTASPPG